MFNLWRINKKVIEPSGPCISGTLTSENIKKILGDSNDITVKEVFTWNEKIKIVAIGIDGLVDSDVIDNFVLRPLTVGRPFENVANEKEAYKLAKEGFLYHFSQDEVTDLNDAIKKILQGVTVVVFDNVKKAISFDAKKVPQRSISEPENENVLNGAKDAFVESLRTNTALIRKKMKSQFLRFESFTIGKESQTPVNIVYLNDIADKGILEELRRRIKNMNVNSLLSARTLEVGISDNRYSIFPQVQHTERVDKFCANLVDGKIGIIIDGLPVAYIVPGILAMFFQAPEDYSENYVLASLIRILRYICVILSAILPGFYIAITTFHPEMIPTKLLISIIQSKEGVPFAIVFEIIGLLIAFELLIEASLRLPKNIGATLSIIGGLIVGEAAVNAKLISPVVVVIIAITGIAGFVIPNQALSDATRLIRMLMVVAAALAGLFGIAFAIIVTLYYLSNLDSFGVPYLSPLAGNDGKGILNDSILRLPRDLEGKKRDN